MEAWNNRKLDYRNKDDILEEMRRLGTSYTPEWYFDEKSDDAGAVIAKIFATQTAENIRHFNQTLDRYHVEFANMYGVNVNAAKPANSIVVMRLADGYQRGGISVKKGTQVIGEGSDGEEIVFETQHDLCVSSSRLRAFYQASASHQLIETYGQTEEESEWEAKRNVNLKDSDGADDQFQNISLFGWDGEHKPFQMLMLTHPYLFKGSNQRIMLRFEGDLPSKDIARLLTSGDHFSFHYTTSEGIQDFKDVIVNDDVVILLRGGEEGAEQVSESGDSSIMIRMNKPVTENIILKTVNILTSDEDGEPDMLWNGRDMQGEKEFLPFTHEFSLYQDLYIGQQEMFRYKGSEITMHFSLSFESFDKTEKEEESEDLKVIKRIPKSQIGKNTYDCFIQEVTFEYFNGKGWKKLASDSNVSQLFAKEENAGEHAISFIIPFDWETTPQGGYEQQMIRMQIIRADNCYMQEVRYHYPVIKNLHFRLAGDDKGRKASSVKMLNGASVTDLTSRFQKQERVNTFSRIPYEGEYAYFGFDRPFGDGTISFFLELQENLGQDLAKVTYSYSTMNGFKSLKVIDQTDNLQHSGIIMFANPSDMAPMELEGSKKYWIRMEDVGGFYSKDYVKNPVLSHFYINAVNVSNIITLDEEDYYIDVARDGMRFPLYASNVLETEVWVNEKEQLTRTEMECMLKETPDLVRAEYNFMHEIEEFYCLWHEIEDFDLAVSQDRVYLLDRINNEIVFGDGIRVKIPLCTESIAFKVRVKCCNGDRGNVLPGTIVQFRGNILSVDEITNPVNAYGGSRIEDMEDALTRGSNILGARRRLVSKSDYEREISLYSDTIAQVACVTGEGKDGNKASNMISMVLLMKDYKMGSFSFKTIQKEIKKHLMTACEMTCAPEDIQVVEPIFAKVSLSLWLKMKDETRGIDIRQQFANSISEFLDPVNSDRWQIGKMPTQSQIRLMLSNLEDEAYIEYMTISVTYTDGTGTHEVELDELQVSPFMICCNGTHKITSHF